MQGNACTMDLYYKYNIKLIYLHFVIICVILLQYVKY